MATIIQALSTEITLGTAANTVNGAIRVRLVELNSNNSLITVADANTTVLGTFTLRQNTELFVKKRPTDTVAANSVGIVKASSATVTI